ncbi:outer membrane protein assembly factor BamE [Pyxidicoccus sp. MSG2]|uniref:outer membrane protein assembly factor BamE n=1 Tax=Pyxidicoccus sp. MSG2 TaxID=2996790 RepID=UPI00226EA889|nr:outer membrane protein assembly factor BamE [Pyxidicoccus sp. MSG2]MCY1018108.1 outer membrane protein assembly factor BamE [Pyxidicoccus sp. MSG2]
MSVDVSTTEPPSSAVALAADSTGLFTAFQNDGRPVPRGRWALALLAALFPVVLGVGFWTLAKNEEHTFRLVTPQGIKSVRGGMTADQVVALLGRPITLEQDATGAECYRYGTPNFINPQFLIYKVCYEDGKLRDVTQHKFSAWSVDPATGTFAVPEGGAPAASPSKDG